MAGILSKYSLINAQQNGGYFVSASTLLNVKFNQEENLRTDFFAYNSRFFTARRSCALPFQI